MSTVTAAHEANAPPQCSAGAHPDLRVFVFVFDQVAQARAAEDRLGQLSADGKIEVFDGVVIDWSGGRTDPSRRSLQNLPRRHAMPDSAWTAILALPGNGAHGNLAYDSPERADARAALVPGRIAVVLLCLTTADLHSDLQQTGSIVTTTMTYADLQALRAHPQ